MSGKSLFCASCGAKLPQPGLVSSCSACGEAVKRAPDIVVAGLVEVDGGILLLRGAHADDDFDLVTGSLDLQETLDEAVVRVVETKTGCRVDATSLIGVYTDFELNSVIIAFHVVATGAVASENEKQRWVEPHALLPWVGGCGDAVRDWLRARGIEFGRARAISVAA